MDNFNFLGSGYLFDRFQNKFDLIDNNFKTFATDDEVKKVWIGDTVPPEDAVVIVSKSNHNDYHKIVQEINNILDNNNKLIAVGVYDVTIEPYMKDLTILICKDRVVRTFQNLNDFDSYLIEYLATLDVA